MRDIASGTLPGLRVDRYSQWSLVGSGFRGPLYQNRGTAVEIDSGASEYVEVTAIVD